MISSSTIFLLPFKETLFRLNIFLDSIHTSVAVIAKCSKVKRGQQSRPMGSKSQLALGDSPNHFTKDNVIATLKGGGGKDRDVIRL